MKTRISNRAYVATLFLALVLYVHAEGTKEASSGASLSPEQIEKGLEVSSSIELSLLWFFLTGKI